MKIFFTILAILITSCGSDANSFNLNASKSRAFHLEIRGCLIDMETKICSKCKQDLPIIKFHKHKNHPSGYASGCKICTESSRTPKREPLIIVNQQRFWEDGILYTEEWKDIEGYEGLYQISSFGRVKSLERKVNHGGAWSGSVTIYPKLLKLYPHQGYLRVALYSGKREKQDKQLVHVLVGQMFIPNPENKPTVNHKKGVKSDNFFKELEWHTVKENINHAIDIGLRDRCINLNRKGSIKKKQIA